MSQEKIYDIIKELGGEATTKEIKDRIKQKYPNATLHLYVNQQLRKLEKWRSIKGGINKVGDPVWEIIDKYR